MSDQEQPQQGAGQPEQDNLANSILMAFNLGVSYNQQTQATKSVTEAVGELGNTIYTNLSQMYGSQFEEDFLRANTEYFLQIAMMGYIVPSICAFDEEFKNRLLVLIEKRAKQRAAQISESGGDMGGGSGIVTP